ncbi:hypothetical protein RhiJN_15599 [Ceratobasidium sp. AG-Ba]|nr:hypothetical protein RhiJN_15599 [Ceratobasidium sp. AG-Ba]
MSGAQGHSDQGGIDDSILVVATGARLCQCLGSSGLGFRALVDFAGQSKENIILVLGCRTPTNPAVSNTFNNIPRIKKLDIVSLDLVNLDSTRAFASHILQSYPKQISVLLLCGGSTLHKGAAQTYRPSPSTIEDILASTPWKPKEAYALSKLVQMHIFQITVDRFAKVTGAKKQPVVVAVCPGFVPQTGLIREYSWWIRFLMNYIMPMMPFTTSLETAGETIMRAMQDQNLTSGDYITPRGSDSLASECMDLTLRSEWRDWLVSKGVWVEEE